MKYARCPNCKGRLGIPDKKRGLPVACPKCETEFVAPTELDGAKASGVKTSSGESKKPKLRSLPMPSSVAAKTPVSKMEVTSSDPMMPPSSLDPPDKSNLDAFAPSRKSSSSDAPKRRSRSESDTVEVEVYATVEDIPDSKKKKRSVAKIVQTEAVQPQLSKDGTLPTLKLNDESDDKPPEEKKSRPMILALIICSSLLCSGLMLLMPGSEASEKQQRIEETRTAIRTYYEIRPDEELKPYQIDLRQAQLAHSRGDYKTEIRAYETVMARFRSEDLSEFVGLTGSPTADDELQRWVSILLSEAKRMAR